MIGAIVADMQESWGVPIAELGNQKVDIEAAKELSSPRLGKVLVSSCHSSRSMAMTGWIPLP